MSNAPADAVAVCREWTPRSLATFYQCILPGWTLPDHLWPVCLGLCDTRIDKLMLIVGPGTGKSTLLSVVYPAWLLGHDPTMTMIGISGGESLMQGFQSAVMDIIQSSPEWKTIFPNVRPDKDAGWSNERGMFVTGRRVGSPFASYLACGLQSRYLVGKHAKTIVLDDLHDDTNSLTVEQCQSVVRKYYNTILGRADKEHTRFILAGRRWHENDIYGELQNGGAWVTMVLPAERPRSRELYFDIHMPEGMDCVFTDGKCLCGDGVLVDV